MLYAASTHYRMITQLTFHALIDHVLHVFKIARCVQWLVPDRLSEGKQGLAQPLY
jgi:hypothetical protein